MNDVAVLLDKAKVTLKASSDAELARHLGVTRASVSNWRTGRNLPDVVQCATLAGLTGEPLARVLGIVGEARAISREEKAVWHRLAASAAALFVLLGATTLPGVGARNAQAAAQSASGQGNATSLCIMRNINCDDGGNPCDAPSVRCLPKSSLLRIRIVDAAPVQ